MHPTSTPEDFFFNAGLVFRTFGGLGGPAAPPQYPLDPMGTYCTHWNRNSWLSVLTGKDNNDKLENNDKPGSKNAGASFSEKR